MTKMNALWVGCIDKKPGVLLNLMPTDSTISISYSFGNEDAWHSMETMTYGPYGLAKHTFPGVKEPIPFLTACDTEPVVHLRWSLQEHREPEGLYYDSSEVTVTFNLVDWRQAADKANSHCKGWPSSGAAVSE